MPNVISFFTYVIITTFTPGPNNIMAMNNASRYGFRKTLIFNAGIFTGFFIIMGLSCLFSTTLYEAIPQAKPVMTIIGACYILWLAWKTLKNHPEEENKIPEENFSGNAPSLGTIPAKKNPDKILPLGKFKIRKVLRTNSFLSGLFLQFVNLKVILYAITIVSTFITPYYGSLPVMGGFSFLLSGVSFLSTGSWALFGTLFQKYFIKNKKIVNVIMALLLVYCAVSLFF